MSALLLLTAALHTNLLNTVNWTDDTGQRHCRCGKHWHQKQNKTLSRLAHAQQLKKNDFLMPVWVTKALRARIPATALLTPVKRRLASAFFGPGQWQHCLPHTQHNAEPAQRRPCQHHRARYLRRRPRRRAHSATPQHARNAQRRLTATPRSAAQRSAARPTTSSRGAEGRRPPSQRPYSASPYLRQTLRLSAAPDQPAQHPAATTSLQRRVGPCLRAARAHGSPAGGRAFLIELRADERAGRGRPEQSSAECVDCTGWRGIGLSLTKFWPPVF